MWLSSCMPCQWVALSGGKCWCTYEHQCVDRTLPARLCDEIVTCPREVGR
jgi:hypothetical protein